MTTHGLRRNKTGVCAPNLRRSNERPVPVTWHSRMSTELLHKKRLGSLSNSWLCEMHILLSGYDLLSTSKLFVGTVNHYTWRSCVFPEFRQRYQYDDQYTHPDTMDCIKLHKHIMIPQAYAHVHTHSKKEFEYQRKNSLLSMLRRLSISSSS